MARGRSRSLPALLALTITVAACSPAESVDSTSVPDSTSSSTSTTTSTTTTSSTTTTTLPQSTTTTTMQLPDIGAEVLVPDEVGPFPAVVLVHGGSWIAGSPVIMRELARYFNVQGFLTVNTRYQLAGDRPGFPDAIDDVACAVRYAAAHPDSDGSVALIGHSAGAHISAVVALTGDDYAEDCPIEGSGVPDRLVGLAGPYDVDRLGFLMLPFFGAGPNVEPEAWEAGNPQGLTDENTDLLSLIMYGENDGLVDESFAINFHAALEDSGSETLLELVEEARHNEMRDPDWVGDLIVTWLER